MILTLCATGVLLAFQPQVLRVAERRARNVAPRPSSAPVAAGSLLRLAARASPGGSPVSLTVSADRGEAAAASFGRERTLYLDPATGAVTGSGSAGWRAFFAKVQDVHRWLAFDGDRRELGKAVTGAASFAFLGLALTGLYIWWPRLRGFERAGSVALFRRGLSGKARDFNWHNVIGVWSAPVLLVLTATALPMSYRWANALVYRIAGGDPPPAGAEGRPRSGREAGGAPLSPADAAALDRLWRVAAARSPGWRAITLRVPERRGAPVGFTIEESGYANRFARSSLTLDPKTGAVVRWEPYAEASGGRRLRSWMRFLHTGEALGPAGQTAAAAASLGGTLLAVTGISLALRRFRAWRIRRAVSPRSIASRSPDRAEPELGRTKGATS